MPPLPEHFRFVQRMAAGLLREWPLATESHADYQAQGFQDHRRVRCLTLKHETRNGSGRSWAQKKESG